jgi:hypothetical protein
VQMIRALSISINQGLLFYFVTRICFVFAASPDPVSCLLKGPGFQTTVEIISRAGTC